MKTVCTTDKCTGCKACMDSCSMNAITFQDAIDTLNAVIDEKKCISCGNCLRVCPNQSSVQHRKSIFWCQGWTKCEEDRIASSSGGFATAIAKTFVKDGGVVCSCALENGRFGFRFAYSEEEVLCFRGSKYVKSDPEGIYWQIKKLLASGKAVLFIGLPCQVAAVRNFVSSALCESLFTIDLICHGTPSEKLLRKYLSQYHCKLENMEALSFRKNNVFGLIENEKPIADAWIGDNYIAAFLKSLSYTVNCYHCQYAAKTRVADITLGDSWGTELEMQEIEKGISLALCQTEKGRNLLEKSNLHLVQVDLARAIQSNAQLNCPTNMPKERKLFMKGIKSGMPFNVAFGSIYPKLYIKQTIKIAIRRIQQMRNRNSE